MKKRNHLFGYYNLGLRHLRVDQYNTDQDKLMSNKIVKVMYSVNHLLYSLYIRQKYIQYLYTQYAQYPRFQR